MRKKINQLVEGPNKSGSSEVELNRRKIFALAIPPASMSYEAKRFEGPNKNFSSGIGLGLITEHHQFQRRLHAAPLYQFRSIRIQQGFQNWSARFGEFFPLTFTFFVLHKRIVNRSCVSVRHMFVTGCIPSLCEMLMQKQARNYAVIIYRYRHLVKRMNPKLASYLQYPSCDNCGAT